MHRRFFCEFELLSCFLEFAMETLDLRLHLRGRLRRRVRRWERISPLGLAGSLHPAVERRILDIQVPGDNRIGLVRLLLAETNCPIHKRGRVLFRFVGSDSHDSSSGKSTESGPGHPFAPLRRSAPRYGPATARYG